jgi:hypothetical protein
MDIATEALRQMLLETLCAQVASRLEPAAQGYTELEIAVMRLRWLGEELSNRGGVALMRLTLDNAIQDHVAGPWLRSLADAHWDGIGRWSERPAPLRGSMG